MIPQNNNDQSILTCHMGAPMEREQTNDVVIAPDFLGDEMEDLKHFSIIIQ